ncbi:MAG: hypothetical protein ACR2F8_03810 [Caulobacteraceae bacterium]
MDRVDPKTKPKHRAPRKTGPYDWSRPLTEVLDAIAPPPPAKKPERRADPAAPMRSGDGFSLAEQIDCVTREVALRENTYPNQIAAGRLTETEAARKIARMRSVLDTLVNLRRMIDSLPRKGRS